MSLFHLTFVHNTFSSVWVAEFEKDLPTRLALCVFSLYFCIHVFVILVISLFGFEGGFGF